MYGFDFEVVKENDFEKLIKVNDDYVSVDIFGSEVDCCVVGYNDDGKLEYECEVWGRWSKKESEYIINKIYKDYLRV
jgi:hypothetical protein